MISNKIAWAALAAAFALMLWPQSAEGAVAKGRSKVQKVLNDAEQFGGCIAYVANIPEGLNCGQNSSNVGWISFDCAGRYSSPSKGRQSFNLATMAMLTNYRLSFALDDREKFGNFCHAYQTSLGK